MNRIETMKAAAEDSSHRWWQTYTSPVDLRDLLAVADAARTVPVQHETRCTIRMVGQDRCDCRVADLNAALARLDAS